MAISVQDIVRARRRYLNSAQLDAATGLLGVEFFSFLAQQGGMPDLQVVEFGPLIGTTTVIANAPCKLYAVIMRKLTTVAASFKLTDDATTGSSTAFALGNTQTEIKTESFYAAKGKPMANGIAVLSNTTMAGNTTSAAGDGAAGVVLLGNP